MTPSSDGAAQTSPAAPQFDPRIWLLALGTFAVGTDNLVIAGILPVVADDLKVGIDSAGLLVTAYALSYGIGSPLMAAITGRLKRERMVVWAIGAFGVANLLCAIAPTYSFLIAARVLAGIAAAVYTPSAYALAVSVTTPERRGRALSTVLMGISSATVLGVPIGTAIGHTLGWHSSFVLVALLSAVAMGALLGIGLQGGEAAPSALLSVAARLRPLTRPTILLALAPNFLWGVGSMAMFAYVSPILSPYFGPSTIVLLLLINGLGGLVGSFFGGRLGDRFGPVRPMIACLSCNAINLTIWGLFNGSFALNAAVMFMYAICGWTMGPSQQVRIIRIDPASTTVTLALNNATFYFGNSIGAAMGGALIAYMQPSDLTFVSAFFAVLCLCALALSVTYNRRVLTAQS
ncbi:MAG TPA: MFS transporter [Magnetospirillaceae bacterium]|jgi:predicted MFS family arabinose efflux permease